jgi:hypothetical protein
MHTVNKPKMMAAESIIEDELPKVKGEADARRPFDGVPPGMGDGVTRGSSQMYRK